MKSFPNKYKQASGTTKTKEIYLRKTVHQSCDSKMYSQIFLKICMEILKTSMEKIRTKIPLFVSFSHNDFNGSSVKLNNTVLFRCWSLLFVLGSCGWNECREGVSEQTVRSGRQERGSEQCLHRGSWALGEFCLQSPRCSRDENMSLEALSLPHALFNPLHSSCPKCSLSPKPHNLLVIHYL